MESITTGRSSNSGSIMLSFISVGTLSVTTAQDLINSDNDLLSNEVTVLDLIAKLWDYMILHLITPAQASAVERDQTPIENTVNKIRNYILLLNRFISVYKYKDLNENKLKPILELEQIYIDINNPDTKPSSDDIENTFKLALGSGIIQNFLKIIPDVNLDKVIDSLNLTPQQSELLKTERINAKIIAKLDKLLKVEKVIHNVMSRLKLRKLVLQRLSNMDSNTAVQPPTVAEKFLDVVNNLDGALVWMDPDVPKVPAESPSQDSADIDLIELRNIRANIYKKLSVLQENLNGTCQTPEDDSTQKIMDNLLPDMPNTFDSNSIDTSPPPAPSVSNKDDVITQNQSSKKPKMQTTHTCKPNVTQAIENILPVVKAIPDDDTDLTYTLPQFQDALTSFKNQDLISELFDIQQTGQTGQHGFNTAEEDIAFILLGLSNDIKPPEGGRRKKSHKITRRNKKKGSNRRRPNKKGKTAKRAKRSMKKH